MSVTIECPFCHKRYTVDESASGKTAQCKICGAKMQIPDLAGAAPSPQPEPPQEPAEPEPQPEPPPEPAGPPEPEEPAELPRQMRANRAVAGRICPVCGAAVELGQPVRNCELCGQTHHDECWTKNNGCGTRDCENAPLPELRLATESEEEPSQGPPPGMKACPHCGEYIPQAAIKCRHCQEFMPGERSRAPAQAATSGMAIGALVCGILSLLCCAVAGPAAIVLGVMARKEIASSGGRIGGSGMALAGIIMGSIGTALAALWIVVQIIIVAAGP